MWIDRDDHEVDIALKICQSSIMTLILLAFDI